MPDLADRIHELNKALHDCVQHQARMDDLWRDFTVAVRARRLEKRVILKELEKLTGIGRGTLFYLENGSREWTIKRARLVAKALK